MSKVLGFKEKYVEKLHSVDTKLRKTKHCGWHVKKPVKPLSVVELAALEKWCKKNKFGYAPPRVNIDELLPWARERAGEGK